MEVDECSIYMTDKKDSSLTLTLLILINSFEEEWNNFKVIKAVNLENHKNAIRNLCDMKSQKMSPNSIVLC